jgi:translocator protein
MKYMAARLLLFLILNFCALAIGGLFTGSGVTSDWYSNLNKAPWTPPGWVFGAAWTIIMICFAIYMAILWPRVENKTMLLILFSLQWILNVSWNPVFFYFHYATFALMIIVILTVVVAYLLFSYFTHLKYAWSLIIPYFIWLLIATSLNAYIVYNNQD